MKDTVESLSTKFYLYESQKENRQGENAKSITSSSSHNKSI
jgi:hypothetical protein